MSIAQVTNIKQHLDKIFGENQGFWEYKTIDGALICYTVRYWDYKLEKKQVRPWAMKDDKLVQGGISGLPHKPVYRIEELKKFPDKPILFVEGEKTADAAAELFPEYNVLTWLGGSSAVKKIDTKHLTNKKVYLFPDNDEAGFKAMKALSEILIDLGNEVHYLDPSFMMLPKGWDLADFNCESGEVDMELIKMMFNDSKPKNDEFNYHGYPHMTDSKKPRPLDTTGNLEYLLESFSIKVRWNMMNRSRDVIVPGKEFYYEESENIALTHITNLAVMNDMPVRRIDKHLDAIALEDRYHPICDWILSRPLVDHGIFTKFLTCIRTTNDDLSYVLIRRWMISAVTAAFSTGNFAPQGVLVIHGEQYTHKSSFIMSLAPKEFRAIKGGLILDPSKKDDVLTASQYWIAELAELDATFKKADSNRLKGFINLDEDSIRKPYAMKDSKMVRRTVFAATVNESKFLIDTTGNRRWWTVSITEPINTYHGLDMQQVWREIYEMYLHGESPNLSKQELQQLNSSNESYEYLDPFYEKFHNAFYWDRDPCQWMNASQVLSEMGYDKPSSGDLKRMGDILTKMKLQKGTGRLRYSYYVPQLKPYGYREM
jgi:putative DNA primase/helicase